MGAGRLKIKRYKTHRGKRRLALLLLLGLGTAISAACLGTGRLQRLLISPAPTLSPEESRTDTRTLTLSGKTWYALQLGAFEREEAAMETAAAFRARGAGGLTEKHAGKYRVLAAAYESRADAQAVQNQLRSRHGVEAYLCEISCCEVTVRVSGQRAQLTALEDAYAALEQLSLQLGALSRGLDQGEMEREAILSALRSHRDTVSSLRQRLLSLFGQEGHPAVQGIMALLSDTESSLAEALGTSGDVRLGAGIKHCHLLVITGLAAYGAGLAP